MWRKEIEVLTLPNYLLRDSDFTKWLSSREGRVWMVLMGCVNNYTNDEELNVKFFKKNKIAVRVSIYNLNKMLGYKSSDKSNVSKIIKNLTKRKIIIKHQQQDGDISSPSVFEVGYLSAEDKSEVPYVVDIFRKSIANKNIESLNFDGVVK